MRVKEPFEIELEYVQRMMAWLLFMDDDSVAERHAMQLGLGAGAITKFCHKKLRMCATAIELNPQVVSVCRAWFKLPHDGPCCAWCRPMPGRKCQRPNGQGTVDALAVDLYDHEAAAPVLDSADFYADCRALLTDERLHDRQPVWPWLQLRAQSLESIAAAFGEDALWAFKPTREGNTIVLAQRTPSRFKRGELAARAELVRERWACPPPNGCAVSSPCNDLMP